MSRTVSPLVALLFAWLASLGLAQGPFGMIAFIDPQGQLALVDPSGGDPQTLTSGRQRVQFPAWSPDGRQLAAIRTTSQGGVVTAYGFGAGGAGSGRDLYLSDSEGPFYLYWSPDSRTVSFLANHPTDGIALHLASVVEGTERVLTTGAPFYWQWSNDSKRLLIHDGFVGEEARLGFTDVSADTLIDDLAEPGYFQAPVISASGRFVAFASAEGGLRRVEIRSNPELADGEGIVRELPHVGLVALGWNPARDLLAVMRPTRDVPRLVGPISLLDAETGGLEVVTTEDALGYFWSPDGRHLAYLTLAGAARSQEFADTGTWLASRAGVEEEQGLPRLDLMLTEIDSGDTRRLTTFRPSPLFVGQFLPFFDQYALSHRLWSPDSRALVLPMLDGSNRSVVTRVDLDGTRTPLAPGDTPFWNRR